MKGLWYVWSSNSSWFLLPQHLPDSRTAPLTVSDDIFSFFQLSEKKSLTCPLHAMIDWMCRVFFLKLLLSLFVSRRACLKKCELTSPTCSICCVEKTKTCCFPVDSTTCTSSGPSLTLTFALLISVVFCCREHCAGRRRSEKQVAYFLNRWTRRETHTFGCRFKKHGSAAKLLLK